MADHTGYEDIFRRQGKRLFVWSIGVLFVVVAIGTVFVSTPYHGSAESITAVENDPGVIVEETDRGYVLEPADASPEAGIVFYPGGRVHPDAYLASLAPLSRETNTTVVIPTMPLNLAVIDYGLGQSGLRPHAADRIIDEHRSIDRWYVGGHSLGGAMACRYAQTETVDGLLMYASYCDVNISDTELDVVSVAGDGDTVLDWDAYEDGLETLPPTAEVTVLSDVNHTQFGSYTGQDEPTGTSFEEAHQQLNAVVIPWLEQSTAERADSIAVDTPHVVAH